MFRYVQRLFARYKKFLIESYEPSKPTVYKIGNKKYIKVKRLNTKSSSKGPYLK